MLIDEQIVKMIEAAYGDDLPHCPGRGWIEGYEPPQQAGSVARWYTETGWVDFAEGLYKETTGIVLLESVRGKQVTKDVAAKLTELGRRFRNLIPYSANPIRFDMEHRSPDTEFPGYAALVITIETGDDYNLYEAA